MKYKTAFRLALKVIGVAVAASSIPTLASSSLHILLSFFPFFLYGGFSSGGLFGYEVWQFLHGLTGFGVGLYLFFGDGWIVNRAIPSNRPYCNECGYELTRAVTGGVRSAERRWRPRC